MWITLSVVGFLGFLAVDVSVFRRRPLVRNCTLALASVALTTALYSALAQGARARLPAILRWAGGILTVAGGALTLYVIFLEIPLWQRRAGHAHSPLVRKGTYAACRHPGFWGTLIFLVGISLLVPGPSVWLLALTWLLLELALVALQDVWVFPERFPEYPAYRERTPFLLPTRESVRTAWRSYRSSLSSPPNPEEESHEEVPGKDK